jgi:short-subunit dehydrogenase
MTKNNKGTALIIGAGSDMAIALAKEYARQGYDLVLAARDTGAISPIASDLAIRHHEADIRTTGLDVLKMETHSYFYNGLPVKPDVAICVVGYLGDQELAETDIDEVRKITDTNYTGCASILNVIASDFEKSGGGTIIGISSVAGDRGRKSNYFYGSAKAAFTSYLSGLRHRLAGKGVKVITVKPGFVSTRMTEGMDLPPALTASPEEVARDIYRAHKRGSEVIYTKWFWRYIMLIIRLLPEGIFKKTNL